jgi:hypothetical protein
MLDIPSRRDAIDDLVLLVHGFSAKRLVMWPLARRLRNEGFRVRQWSYPTLLIPLRNTRLASESKHDVVVGTHNSILFSPRVGAKAACFLKTGDWREPSGRK